MAHTLPYPALVTSDVDYVTKMQANLDYLRDLLILQQLVSAYVSTTAAFSSGQIAQYGILGSSLSTGAAGIPTAAIVTNAITEPVNKASAIVEADINYSSVLFTRTGATGIKINRGTKTISYVATTGVITQVTFATDSDEYVPFATGVDQFFAFPISASNPGNPVVVSGYIDTPGTTTATANIAVYSVETTTWTGLTVAWFAIGK